MTRSDDRELERTVYEALDEDSRRSVMDVLDGDRGIGILPGVFALLILAVSIHVGGAIAADAGLLEERQLGARDTHDPTPEDVVVLLESNTTGEPVGVIAHCGADRIYVDDVEAVQEHLRRLCGQPVPVEIDAVDPEAECYDLRTGERDVEDCPRQ